MLSLPNHNAPYSGVSKNWKRKGNHFLSVRFFIKKKSGSFAFQFTLWVSYPFLGQALSINFRWECEPPISVVSITLFLLHLFTDFALGLRFYCWFLKNRVPNDWDKKTCMLFADFLSVLSINFSGFGSLHLVSAFHSRADKIVISAPWNRHYLLILALRYLEIVPSGKKNFC